MPEWEKIDEVILNPQAALEELHGVKTVINAAEKLIESVNRDVNGIPGAPFSGNGGLVSNDTIRAADEARLALSRFKREIDQPCPPSPSAT